jgi:glycosyltransferase involved in cell wall biosynthesis
VSVCFPTYNGAATVERALLSLLAQSYPHYEIIISDDHSSDDTLAICERVTANHPKVRFVRPEQNLGFEGNMRFALAAATGKYFVWACQDDYWDPQFLERLVGALEEVPTAACAQGAVRWFSEDGLRTKELRLYGRDLPERQSRLSLATSLMTRRGREDRLKVKNSIFMHGVWNRAVFDAALVAHQKPFSCERQILCQAALAGDFVYVDQLLFYKQFYDVELDERAPETDEMIVMKRQSTRWTEVQDTLEAIMRSPIVSPGMKPVAIVAISLAYFRHRSRVKNLATKKIARSLRQLWPQRQ